MFEERNLVSDKPVCGNDYDRKLYVNDETISKYNVKGCMKKGLLLEICPVISQYRL